MRPLTVISKLVLSVLVCVWVPMSASADELYQYTNEDGVTVLDSHIPVRYVKNGYTILSPDGRVLEVVPRALTKKQRRERDKKLAAQKKLVEEKKQRQMADQELLRLYGTPEDVVRARNSKLASVREFIETNKGNIQRLDQEERNIEAALADVERAGGTIDKDRVDRLHVIQSQVAQIQSQINDKQAEITELKASFAADLKRVRELYGIKAAN